MQLTPSDPAWWDWSLANALSLSQLILTAAGFILAIVQLWRTANASVKSKSLLETLRVRIISNDLLVVLPDLTTLEDGLEATLRAGEPEDVEDALRAYARKASEVVGMLDADSGIDEAELIKQLRAAATAATKAKAEIAGGTERTMRAATAAAGRKIATANHEAAAVRSRLQRKAE